MTYRGLDPFSGLSNFSSSMAQGYRDMLDLQRQQEIDEWERPRETPFYSEQIDALANPQADYEDAARAGMGIGGSPGSPGARRFFRYNPATNRVEQIPVDILTQLKQAGDDAILQKAIQPGGPARRSPGEEAAAVNEAANEAIYQALKSGRNPQEAQMIADSILARSPAAKQVAIAKAPLNAGPQAQPTPAPASEPEEQKLSPEQIEQGRIRFVESMGGKKVGDHYVIPGRMGRDLLDIYKAHLHTTGSIFSNAGRWGGGGGGAGGSGGTFIPQPAGPRGSPKPSLTFAEKQQLDQLDAEKKRIDDLMKPGADISLAKAMYSLPNTNRKKAIEFLIKRQSEIDAQMRSINAGADARSGRGGGASGTSGTGGGKPKFVGTVQKPDGSRWNKWSNGALTPAGK